MNTGWLLAGLVPHRTTRSLSITSWSEQVDAATPMVALSPTVDGAWQTRAAESIAGHAHGPGRLAGHVVHLVRDAAAREVDRHAVLAGPRRWRRTARRGPRPSRSAGTRARPAGGASGGPAVPCSRSSVAERSASAATSASTAWSNGSAVLSLSRLSRVVHRWMPSMVQSCRPATPERAPVAGALGQHVDRVLRVAAVGPGHLGHVAVVVGLLQPDAVGPPAHPARPAPAGQLLTQAHRRPPASTRCRWVAASASARAHEAGQGEAGLAGRLDGEGRRGAHRHDRAEAGRPGLLHDLEAGPSAHVQPEVRGRQAVVEEQPAHDLVDGVVPADVLAHDQRRARRGRRPRPRARRRWRRTAPAAGPTRSGTPASSVTGHGAPAAQRRDAVAQLVDGDWTRTARRPTWWWPPAPRARGRRRRCSR